MLFPRTKKKAGAQSGFSVLEMIITMSIMVLVVGIVVDGLVSLMHRNDAETAKVDLTQEARQFEDQIVSDIHQSGFPSLKMFDPATGATLNSANVSQGLVNVTPTSLQFEADVDGSGTVSEVFIQMVPAGGPCPCVIQRGTISKTQFLAGQVPFYYTEVNNVVNTAAIPVFQGYDNAGNPVPLAGAPSNNLNAIEITLNVRSASPDTSGVYTVVTMSTGAKIHNFN